MIRVFDFKCDRGHVREYFVRHTTVATQCMVCQEQGLPSLYAHRQISAPQAKLDGCSGDFPSAASKWERTRESHMRKEQHNQREHGSYK